MGTIQQRILHQLAIVSFLLTSTLPAAAGQVRLVGSTRCSGRVEIYYNSAWGSVCDDDWDLKDAEVVCRQLDCGVALSAPGSARFGPATDNIWLDDVHCEGNERSLTECPHKGFGTHNCQHGEDAGVECSGLQPSISLVSPDGGLVWGPEGAEVTRGYSCVFTCSISSQYPGGVFSLIFSGISDPIIEPAVNRSASFHFLAEYVHEGNYSCVYEVQLSKQSFTSNHTATVHVLIKKPLLPLVSLVAAGGLLLLLLVLVGKCLRRRGATQPVALVQTQTLTVKANNVNKKLKGEEEQSNNYEEQVGGVMETSMQI